MPRLLRSNTGTFGRHLLVQMAKWRRFTLANLSDPEMLHDWEVDGYLHRLILRALERENLIVMTETPGDWRLTPAGVLLAYLLKENLAGTKFEIGSIIHYSPALDYYPLEVADRAFRCLSADGFIDPAERAADADSRDKMRDTYTLGSRAPLAKTLLT